MAEERLSRQERGEAARIGRLRALRGIAYALGSFERSGNSRAREHFASIIQPIIPENLRTIVTKLRSMTSFSDTWPFSVNRRTNLMSWAILLSGKTAELRQFTYRLGVVLWNNRQNPVARLALARLVIVSPDVLPKRLDAARGILRARSQGSVSVHEDGTYQLCGSSETYLFDAFEDGNTRLVNDHFVLKYTSDNRKHGYMAAVCTKTHRTKNGQLFIAGIWYQPTKQSKKGLREMLKSGEQRLSFPTIEWIVRRSFTTNNLQYKHQEKSARDAFKKVGYDFDPDAV